MLMMLAALTMASGIAAAQSEPGSGTVISGRIDGAIDPTSASILNGWIETAESRGASLFVLELDTPGEASTPLVTWQARCSIARPGRRIRDPIGR